MKFSTRIAGSLVALAAAVSITACDLTDSIVGKITGDSVSNAAVDELEVRSQDNAAPYDRTGQFGRAWTDQNSADMGGNGCDTRNDILARDLDDVKYDDMVKRCTAVSGTLDDPYTGNTVNFVRGQATSSAVQIDHIVALKDAWISGADQLTQQERVNLANDPENLVASDGPANMSKGSQNASTWLVPDNEAYRCDYAQAQVNVKKKYNLSVSPSEQTALSEQLNNC